MKKKTMLASAAITALLGTSAVAMPLVGSTEQPIQLAANMDSVADPDPVEKDQRWSYEANRDGYQKGLVGEYTAEDLIDHEVVASNGESVGEIDDLLISSNNEVDSVIVDVGGFLGIGGRIVAIEIDRLKPDEDGGYAIDMTEEEIGALREYEQRDGEWMPSMG